MKKNNRVCQTILRESQRGLLGALFLYAAIYNSGAGAFAQAAGIRSLNFNEFSYPVGPPYCDGFGPVVKVHRGKFANDKDKFEVSQVMYGNLTGAGDEEAVIVATCAPKVPATGPGGFNDDVVYVYAASNGKVALRAVFAFGEPLDSQGKAQEPSRSDRLLLFDITGVSVGPGSISFERMAGEAHCCPKFSITQTFRWADGRFVLAGEQRRPWK